MNFIGIDPSLTCTGIICLNEKGEIEGQELIKTKSSDDDEFRIVYIWDKIYNFINKYESEKCLISIEGISYGSRNNPVIKAKLSGLHYYIRICLKNLKKSFEIIPPKTLKKFILKGNMKKELILLIVYKRWGVSFDDNNLADSYGLARKIFEDYHE